jgi:hypothetical protein
VLGCGKVKEYSVGIGALVCQVRGYCGGSLLNVVMSPVDTRSSKETTDQMGETKEIKETEDHKQY